MRSVSRDVGLLLDDVAKSCEKIARFCAGLSRDEFFRDELRLDGVLYNLHVIGEAVKKLPEEFRRSHPEIPWREIAGMRDFIAHVYFALDLEILWSAVQDDVPKLREQVSRLR